MKNPKEDLSTFVYGKVPPQAIPLEEAVLGAVLIDKDAVEVIADILPPEAFYLDAHKLIFQAVKNLFLKQQPVDLLTVTEQLKVMGKLKEIGGAYYLVEMTNKVASSANIEYHARLISQKYIQRELIRVGNQAINAAYQDVEDVFELVDQASNSLKQLESPFTAQNSKSGDTLAQDELARFDAIKIGGVATLFTETGLAGLDKYRILRPTRNVVLAARPGMGKTALVLCIASYISVKSKKPVAIFSLEMSSEELIVRLISELTGIPSDRLDDFENISEEELKLYYQALSDITDSGLIIDDTPAISIEDLDRRVRALKKKHPDLDGVIIDYLQLMSGSKSNKGNREGEIGEISRGIKAVAKRYKIWTLPLSQLSRAVEIRGGVKRPQLSDLRDSGSVEQDADMVAFIYRPEYYDIVEDEDGRSTNGLAEIIIAKNRHGPTGTVKLLFTKELTRFSNWEQSNSFPSSTPASLAKIEVRKVWEEDGDLPF